MGVRIPPGLPHFIVVGDSGIITPLGCEYMFDKIKQFLKEVKIELKKVVWPTRKDTIASTSVVLVIVTIIAIFLGLVDLGLSRIIRLILG